MKHIYTFLWLILALAAPVAGIAQNNVNINDTILSPTEYDTACSSYMWAVNGSVYSQTGEYHDTSRVDGRVHVSTLSLTIYPTPEISIKVISSPHCGNWEISIMNVDTNCSYLWGNSSSDSLSIDTAIIADASDTYYVTIIDTNNCSNLDSMTTVVNPIYSVTDTKTICQDFLPYIWDGVTFTEAGTQTDTLETIHGCDSVVTKTLVVNPTYNVTETRTICQNSLPYPWNNGVIFNEAGDTTVTFQTISGCDSVVTMTLIVNPLPQVSIASSSATDTVCGGGVVLMANANPDYEYLWNTGAVNSWISVDSSNTYSVTVTDPTTHCSNSASKVIIVNQPYNLTINSTICQGESVNFFGETKDSTGVYIRTNTAENGCDSTVTLVLTVNPLPVFVITGDLEICEGDTTTLTAQGENTYQWNTGSTGNSISVFQSGIYKVTATKDICTASDSVTVNVYPLPTVSINGDNSFCEGDSTTLVAYGASTYTWSNGASGDSTTVSYPGFYTVTGTNTNGCSSTDTITVRFIQIIYSSESVTRCQGDSVEFHGQIYKTTGVYTYTNNCDTVETLTLVVNPLPNVTISGESSFCEGDGTMLIAMGANTYAWKNGSNNDTSYVTTADTITVTGTDTNNCSNTASLIVTMNPTYYNNTIIRDTICEGESYIFYGDTLTTSCSRPHTLQTVNGCDSVVTLYLTVNPQPEVSINGPSSFCQGDSIPLVVEGASSYVWNNNVRDSIINVVSAGIYSVTGTDANGCKNTAMKMVTMNPLPTPTIIGNSQVCSGTSTTVTAFGGNSYLWSNGETGNSISVVDSGTYTVTVTNEYSCTATDAFTLTVHPLPVVSIDGVINGDTSFCEGDSIVLTANGNAVSYAWSNGVTTASNTIYYPNTYTVTGTDEHGCTNIATKTVSVTYPVIDTLPDVKECGSYEWNNYEYTTSGYYTQIFEAASGCDSIVTLHLTINDPVHTAVTVTECGSYTWNGGNGQTYTASDDYYYEHLDANGCTQVDTLHLTINGGMDTTKIVRKNKNQGRETYMLIYPKDSLFYQWYKDEEPILGANGQYYVLDTDTNAQNGCYKVLVTPQTPGACGSFTDTCCVNNPTSHSKTLILPNPNDGQFRLMIPEGTVNVQILDVNGQVVMARKVDGDEMLEMNTGLANGLYFVKTFRTDGSFNTEKLVINR